MTGTMQKDLQALLRQLTPKQHRRYLLYFRKGRTYREIASLEGTTHQAIHKSVAQIRKKFRKNRDLFRPKG